MKKVTKSSKIKMRVGVWPMFDGGVCQTKPFFEFVFCGPAVLREQKMKMLERPFNGH